MIDKTNAHPSKRVEQHEVIRKEALRYPGVYDVMEVYGAWERADRGLDAHRIASREAWVFTTTDRTSARNP